MKNTLIAYSLLAAVASVTLQTQATTKKGTAEFLWNNKGYLAAATAATVAGLGILAGVTGTFTSTPEQPVVDHKEEARQIFAKRMAEEPTLSIMRNFKARGADGELVSKTHTLTRSQQPKGCTVFEFREETQLDKGAKKVQTGTWSMKFDEGDNVDHEQMVRTLETLFGFDAVLFTTPAPL